MYPIWNEPCLIWKYSCIFWGLYIYSKVLLMIKTTCKIDSGLIYKLVFLSETPPPKKKKKKKKTHTKTTTSISAVWDEYGGLNSKLVLISSDLNSGTLLYKGLRDNWYLYRGYRRICNLLLQLGKLLEEEKNKKQNLCQ